MTDPISIGLDYDNEYRQPQTPSKLIAGLYRKLEQSNFKEMCFTRLSCRSEGHEYDIIRARAILIIGLSIISSRYRTLKDNSACLGVR